MGAAAPQPKDPLVCPLPTSDIVGTLLAVCERMNGIEFYAYQRALGYRIIESLLLNDGAVITGLFSRQSGKSETLASISSGICVVLPWLANSYPNDERLSMFKGGVKIGIFAPKLELSGPIYLKIRERVESELGLSVLSDAGVEITQSRGDSLAFTNGSFVRANTASELTINEGATYHLILIDEAQRVSRSKVDKEIAPMLAATNGTMVKIGTAWMSRGGFHNDIQNNNAVEQKGGKRNHYQFDYEQVIREKRALYNKQKKQFEAGDRTTPPDPFHLKYEKWVMSEIARLGGRTDSEEFKMNFRLLWQESRAIAIKETTWRELQLPSVEMNIPKHFGYQVAGLDVAKDDDSTVLTILEVDRSSPIVDLQSKSVAAEGSALYYRKYVLGLLELQGSFEGHQYNEIMMFLRDFAVRYMLVDATGMGDPVCERLQVLLRPFGIEVEPFKYTTPSKSDLFKYYLQEVEARRFMYPAGEETQRTPTYKHFCEQHIELEREYNGSYLVCAAPEGSHDDYPCSAAMATWASKRTVVLMPEIESESMDQLYGSSYDNRMGVVGVGDSNSRAQRYLRGRRR